MKVIEHDSHTVTSGDLKPIEMGISDNAEDQLMILNVLSNTLYTNKVQAVLREYGCNAYDANVEAGNEALPIKVRLPNKLEPTVSIRDYGYGMTEEQMRQTFCRLGRSTKRNSNAFTGMLGIGSKAGFAYGDSFLVTSFTKGVKCVYNAFRDKGVPQLAKMLETKTDERDGVEIKVPVRTDDVYSFQQEAARVFQHFKVRPEITGANVTFDDRPTTFEGGNWRYMGGGESFAIMGNVGYAINQHALTPANAPAQQLIKLGIELRFEIGELEISANREGLQYKDTTNKAILKRLSEVRTQLGTIFTTEIAAAPNMWTARKIYGEAFEQMGAQGTVRSLKEVIDGKVSWKGTPVNTGRVDINSEKYDDVNLFMYTKRYGWRNDLDKGPNPTVVYARDCVTFVINDLPGGTGSPSRVKGFFETHTDEGTVMITCKFPDIKTQDKFWKEKQLEGANVIQFSSIQPSLAVANTTSSNAGPSKHKSKHSAKVFILKDTGGERYSRAQSTYWETAVVDLKADSGVYVVIDKFQVKTPKTSGSAGWPQDACTVHSNMLRYKKAGLLTGPLYGFKQDRAAKLAGNSNWVPLEVHLQTEMNTLLAKGLAQQLADALHADPYQALIPDKFKSKFNADTPMRLYLEALWEARHPKIESELRQLLLDVGADDNWLKQPVLPKSSVDFKVMENSLWNAYPMLRLWNKLHGRHLLTSLGDTQIQVIADYVNKI